MLLININQGVHNLTTRAINKLSAFMISILWLNTHNLIVEGRGSGQVAAIVLYITVHGLN